MVPGRLAGTGLESRPFSKCSHRDVFLCCNKKRNSFLEFHNENYFATAGVSDDAIYSSTENGLGEDEVPWIPRPLSSSSEDPT